MRTTILQYLILYSFIFAGLITIWETKLYQTALSLLVFSSIFASFLYRTGDILGTLVYGSLLALLPAYLFYIQYEGPFRKSSENDRSVGDMILSYLMVLFLVFLFKKVGAGWSLSLLMGYWMLYLFILIEYRNSRRVFYYAKIPFVLLSLGTLIEVFGLQSQLLPFVIVYAAIFILWLKHDLPRMTREPKIA